MAKALLGHMGGTDLRLVAELRRLQLRVKELEAEVADLQRENDALGAEVQGLHGTGLIELEAEVNGSALAGTRA
ncbi:hypothetical protein [Vallicoccus soli]|uniref:Uncharacterized protein n=1 Tax=Vallicoccus soli TaxID=2339232 RepID=A0A3A3Z5K7_9ACTN|nr:hypothetical protein [Vallicoccus soli]RJK98248.1 hypothetical protein D5H78_04995 [Vallicoccus soli]